jgi:hypothetical protein
VGAVIFRRFGKNKEVAVREPPPFHLSCNLGEGSPFAVIGRPIYIATELAFCYHAICMYKIAYSKEAAKTMLKIPRNTARRIREKLERLAADPLTTT